MTVSAGKARSYALALLRYRSRSEKELQDRLRRKGFLPQEIESTVDYLKAAGFINDVALAEDLKRQAMTHKLLGNKGARRFMQQRGLSREVIDAALGYDEEEELRNIRKLIDKKQKTTNAYPEPKRTRAMVGFLMRKGYQAGLIRKALNNTIADEEMDA